MEKPTAERRLRFFAFTRLTTLLLIGGLTAAALSAQVNSGGFLAADFAKGQKQSAYPDAGFQRPLLGLTLYGESSGRISYFGQALFTPDEDFTVTDAWVRFALADYLLVRLGLYTVPFAEYNENSLPHQSRLAVRPLHAEYLFPRLWRDVGVMAEGRWSGLTYSAWLGNGPAEAETLAGGQQFRDNNADKAWGLRAGLDLGQGTQVVYSLSRSHPDAGGERALNLQALNLSWRTTEIEITAEYTRARFDAPDLFDEGAGDGYLVQAVVHFSFLIPVISYQKIDYSDGFRGTGFAGAGFPGAGIDVERTRWTVGAVFPLAAGFDLKLEYDVNREPEPSVDDNLLTIQLAARF